MITAQNLLNGPGFDDNFMLEKARRELNRIKASRDIWVIYDHIINFAVSIASVVDWTFHLKLKDDPKWNRKGVSAVEFAYWIRTQSDQVAAFIDISNECKHADRRHPNFVAEKVLLSPIWEHDRQRFSADDLKYMEEKGYRSPTNGGQSSVLVFPNIKMNSKQRSLYDVAEEALQWWKAFDPALAVPMDKYLNPVP